MRVSKNNIQRTLLGINEYYVANKWGWKDEELHKLCATHSTVKVFKSTRNWRMKHVGRMKKKKIHIKFWLENPTGKYHLRNLGLIAVQTDVTGNKVGYQMD
jgi:hypothetical protein